MVAPEFSPASLTDDVGKNLGKYLGKYLDTGALRADIKKRLGRSLAQKID